MGHSPSVAVCRYTYRYHQRPLLTSDYLTYQAGQSLRAFGAQPDHHQPQAPPAPSAPSAAPCAFYPGTGGHSCNATTSNEPLPLRYTAAALWQRCDGTLTLTLTLTLALALTTATTRLTQA